MGGIALLARELSFTVSGSDANVYPPMSTQLEQSGIQLSEGYDPAHLEPKPDLVVIGNAMSRGNPAVEYTLNQGLPYMSGPAFLSQYVLQGRWVLGVAGTHGKTSTSSMLAWILEYAGMAPGFLIGGVSSNFPVSARLGDTPFFIVEADEYDTAFFDKRSKFVHYRPRTLIMNNLEFDHADIFDDLDAIKRQFHHLVRIVPGEGLIIRPAGDSNIQDVIEQGCWTAQETFANTADQDHANWQATNISAAGNAFTVQIDNKTIGRVEWSQIGQHNVANALAAIAAARHSGVPPACAIEALAEFKGIKRRMELRGVINNIHVYDDFAHHPTAITTTLAGLRQLVGTDKIIAILEPRSNTMKMGVHQQTLADSLSLADNVILFQPAGMNWSLQGVTQHLGEHAEIFDNIESIVKKTIKLAKPGSHILIMSNGSFDGIHEKLLAQLEALVASNK